ncbi:hypothetical protein [Demequina iriomotensis]|uniref:hypothetical protein n=1 Tax=Demequina iriomotensis TaxID=1536641 RepID=UPI000782BBD3|nr:hypothetical protein [Demequina iriomotensis]
MIPGQQANADHRNSEGRDPQQAGVSEHGDGAAPPEPNRTWIAFVAMAVVVGAAVVGWNAISDKGDDAARTALAGAGATIADDATDDVTVSVRGDGFRLFVSDATPRNALSGTAFDIAIAGDAAATDGCSPIDWPQDGVTAVSCVDDAAVVRVSTSEGDWTVTPPAYYAEAQYASDLADLGAELAGVVRFDAGE